MLTENEQKVINILMSNPHISLRGIVKELQLQGAKLSNNSVASVSYIINSLEKKEFLKKVGVTTTKHYQLTEESYKKFNQKINLRNNFISLSKDFSQSDMQPPVTVGSTGAPDQNNFAGYLPKDFGNGSGRSDTTQGIGTFLSASLTKIMDDSVSWEKYGSPIVWAIIFSAIVLPLSYKILKDQWLVGFVLVALLLIIINKK